MGLLYKIVNVPKKFKSQNLVVMKGILCTDILYKKRLKQEINEKRFDESRLKCNGGKKTNKMAQSRERTKTNKLTESDTNTYAFRVNAGPLSYLNCYLR